MVGISRSSTKLIRFRAVFSSTKSSDRKKRMNIIFGTTARVFIRVRSFSRGGRGTIPQLRCDKSVATSILEKETRKEKWRRKKERRKKRNEWQSETVQSFLPVTNVPSRLRATFRRIRWENRKVKILLFPPVLGFLPPQVEREKRRKLVVTDFQSRWLARSNSLNRSLKNSAPRD